MRFSLFSLAAILCARVFSQPVEYSGVYPSLAMFNDEGECGTGAVVPWADRLWVVTYAPHAPRGSSDKLYEITPDLRQIVRPESIGGTPANRMIHRESNQLFIGPYAVGADRSVRVMPYSTIFGRPTGMARHLTEPGGKIMLATMEEGIYEIDTKTLEVKELWGDEANKTSPRKAGHPGYHGKGFYSGQGRYVYSNNGEYGPAAQSNPLTPSGALAEWDGKSESWTQVRRNQFTEVTGPGGIYGNADPENDPVWTVGWDAKSIVLMSLTKGRWSVFRLPKASHSYDGAHGWNTEWPRIREIGEEDLLLTMHGMFWKFPATFSAENPRGIRARSSYLKVIGDFARWGERVVFGCDDTAKNEFLNKRKQKGGLLGPGQSQSNLWFVNPAEIDRFGPTEAHGSVWLRQKVTGGEVSDPMLNAGWKDRCVSVINHGDSPASVVLEADLQGDGVWTAIQELDVGAGDSVVAELQNDSAGQAEWLRARVDEGTAELTVAFGFRSEFERPAGSDAIFRELSPLNDSERITGLLRARGENKRTLQFALIGADAGAGSYEWNGTEPPVTMNDAKADEWMRANVSIPANVISVDAASVLVIDDKGRRWRLPKGDKAHDALLGGEVRICREVCTERDLFQAHGTFYELPAENADGFRKLRPVASHNYHVSDYATFRGLLLLSGLSREAVTESGKTNPHIVASADGKAAFWAGTIDDLWKMGKPVGTGGPWEKTAVKVGEPSDPYLFRGYDARTITLTSTEEASFTVQLDVTGMGDWCDYLSEDIPSGGEFTHEFPRGVSAYWLRVVSDADTTASARLTYR